MAVGDMILILVDELLAKREKLLDLKFYGNFNKDKVNKQTLIVYFIIVDRVEYSNLKQKISMCINGYTY